ncbi:hypothetical protein SLA2020_048530 [Shorea laevis]
MGQFPFIYIDCDYFASDQISYLLSPGMVSSDFVEFDEEFSVNLDYINEIPNECSAYIFQFLGTGNHKQCLLVCKRWQLVDGQNCYHLSLDVRSEIVDSLSSIFTCFYSVNKLVLRCDRKSISLSNKALVLISTHCPNLNLLKLCGSREITNYKVARFAKNCKNLRKLSCGSCMFGAKALNVILNYCTNL